MQEPVTLGDNVPATSKGDELPQSEELSNIWELQRAALENFVCYIFDGFIICQLVMCDSCSFITSLIIQDFVPERLESVQDSHLKVRAELCLRARLEIWVSGKYIRVMPTSLDAKNE